MKKFITTIFVLTSFFLLSFITAQTTAEKKPSPQWWVNSSFADSVDYFLFHGEGRYNYTKTTGSVEGEMQSGSVNLVIRKDVFTHHTEYMIDKTNQNFQSLGMHFATESQALTDYLDVDITRLFYAEGGFIWERDNTIYIQNRFTLYAGLGLNGMIATQHYLKILFAAGNINQEYSIPVTYFNVIKGANTAYYIRQQYKYVINPALSFMEQAYYLSYFSTSDKYRYGIGANLLVAVFQPLSLVLGYDYRFDNQNKLIGVISANTTQTIGVQISL